jgi:hypothetical protein
MTAPTALGPSPVADELLRMLAGASYPARPADLVDVATRNNAPTHVLTALAALPAAEAVAGPDQVCAAVLGRFAHTPPSLAPAPRQDRPAAAPGHPPSPAAGRAPRRTASATGSGPRQAQGCVRGAAG